VLVKRDLNSTLDRVCVYVCVEYQAGVQRPVGSAIDDQI